MNVMLSRTRLLLIVSAFCLLWLGTVQRSEAATTIVVNSLDDNGWPTGDCSLRDAIDSANGNLAADGCTAGTAGRDTIVFDPTLAGHTIQWHLGRAFIEEDVTIEGSVTIDASYYSRIFTILPDVNATFVDLTLQRGKANYDNPLNTDVRYGLDSASGGAIYGFDAQITVRGVTFRDNSADTSGGAIASEGTRNRLDVRVSRFERNVAKYGGAVWASTALTMHTNSFHNNTAFSIGGAVNNVGQMTIDNTIFERNKSLGNYADGTGGAIMTYNHTTIRNSTFAANQSGGGGSHIGVWADDLGISDTIFRYGSTVEDAPEAHGGAIWARFANVTITNSTLFTNRTTGDGGAIWADSNTSLSIWGSQLNGNKSDGDGGAIYWSAEDTLTPTHLTIRETTVFNNNALGNGGGISAEGNHPITITGSEIYDNHSSEDGGGLYAVENFAGFEVADSTFRNNGAFRGGGMYLWRVGNGTIRTTTLSQNFATVEGGGVSQFGTPFAIEYSNFHANSTTGKGGGLFHLYSDMTIIGTRFTSNLANTCRFPVTGCTFERSGMGGGIFTYGTTTVIDSALQYNIAALSGGGVALVSLSFETASMTMRNSTVAYNTGVMRGGGIWQHTPAETEGAATGLFVYNSTISQNGGRDGGGLLSNNSFAVLYFTTVYGNDGNNINAPSGDVWLSNSIVAHSQWADCVGNVSQIPGDVIIPNLDSDGSCGASVTGDPKLGSLTSNGGIAPAHPLRAGSPAIDAGDATTCAGSNIGFRDQHYVSRTAPCDLGALEYVEVAIPAGID